MIFWLYFLATGSHCKKNLLQSWLCPPVEVSAGGSLPCPAQLSQELSTGCRVPTRTRPSHGSPAAYRPASQSHVHAALRHAAAQRSCTAHRGGRCSERDPEPSSDQRLSSSHYSSCFKYPNLSDFLPERPPDPPALLIQPYLKCCRHSSRERRSSPRTHHKPDAMPGCCAPRRDASECGARDMLER